MPGDSGYDFCNEEVTKYFATSFELCLKRQVIDLLAEGYSCEQLDAQPAITVEDWYCGRTDCGCSYEITVCLLDENHEVIQDFKPELVNLDPDCDDCSWKQSGEDASPCAHTCLLLWRSTLCLPSLLIVEPATQLNHSLSVKGHPSLSASGFCLNHI
ncbi:F-box only protein 2 isoform X2 [Micropterus dolomieu]|uniref:F-box only protein 2 isoform X2 n=1 Tax=Micropterus dolomieu TaxID=147949 RepID=UPI001E8D6DB7|nr:F-box only protein 2 isoform X2 [Micropterus dolomieu]XP_045931233.1 F-box only protein 2 isoform X2 [Micropterus dolomieu]